VNQRRDRIDEKLNIQRLGLVSCRGHVGNHTPREIHTGNGPVVQTEGAGQACPTDQTPVSSTNRGGWRTTSATLLAFTPEHVSTPRFTSFSKPFEIQVSRFDPGEFKGSTRVVPLPTDMVKMLEARYKSRPHDR
jgi:hypothetical protein